MPSTYSTNLALELIAAGEQIGTWGDTTNVNLGTLLEQAISGYVTQAITDGADTTITIPNGATGVARNMCIEMTDALTAARNLIVPANKKLYFIYNNTTGGYAVTVKVSGQTGVSVPNGKRVVLVSNGTDIVVATNYMSTLTTGSVNGLTITTSTGTLTVTNGKTLAVSNTLTLAGTDGTTLTGPGVDATLAALNVEDQALTGGVIVTSKSLGTISSGTVTPDPGDRPMQHYTNNGAHTLGVSANAGSIVLDITNGASAGAITTSGFTKVAGDAFTTTNGHKFRCSLTVGNAGSLLQVQAMQ